MTYDACVNRYLLSNHYLCKLQIVFDNLENTNSEIYYISRQVILISSRCVSKCLLMMSRKINTVSFQLKIEAGFSNGKYKDNIQEVVQSFQQFLNF